MSAVSVRGNYTISKKAKDNTDYLKKEYKLNISELVSNLLEFDNNSINKIFEIYKKMNPDIIKESNRLETTDGLYVWNKNMIDAIKRIPLSELDSNTLPLVTLEANNIIYDNNNTSVVDNENREQIKKMIETQNKMILGINNLIDENRDFKKQIKELQETAKS